MMWRAIADLNMIFERNSNSGSRPMVIVGLLASVTASVCCLGPFVLLATGISGAWMSRVMIVGPIQPLLIVLAVSLFAIAGWKLFGPAVASTQSDDCETCTVGLPQKLTYFVLAGISAVLLTSEYWILAVAG